MDKAELLWSHAVKGRFLHEKKFLKYYQDVFLTILAPRGSDPKQLHKVNTFRFGVLPIFFTKDGIIALTPRRGLVKYIKDHYTLNTLKHSINPEIVHLDQPADYSIIDPFFGYNFGHQLSVTLGTLNSFHQTPPKSTTLLSYPTYDHLIQLKDEYIRAYNQNNQTTYKIHAIDQLHTIYVIPKLELYKMLYTPCPHFLVKEISSYILQHCSAQSQTQTIQNNTNYLYEKIALIKTDKNKNLSNQNRLTFDDEIIQKVTDLGFHVLDHEQMHLSHLLYLLKNAKQVIVSWGAIAYFTMFLRNHQRCLTLLHHGYGKQFRIKKDKVCFNKQLFSNYVITEPLPDNPSSETLEKLVREVFD